MRPFEIALLVSCTPLLLWPLPPLRKRRGWVAATLALLVLFTTLHLFLEGYRWQMVPAYILVVLLSVLRVARLVKPSMEQRRLKPLSIIVGGLGLLFLAIAFALPLLFPVFRFPRPTGPYPVGTVTHHWIDTSRSETFTEDPADHRELMVQIWYPAEPTPRAKSGPYTVDADVIAPVLAKVQFGLPPFVFSHLRHIRTNAIPNAVVAETQPRYPVLLFSPGRGGLRVQNTFQVEELVSHGYVVVGIDHPYAAAATVFPDGRMVPMDSRLKDKHFLESKIGVLVGDARFVLDQLETLNASDPNGQFQGRLDLSQVGIFGHSLGGIVAAEACHFDARFKAGLNLDTYVPQSVVESGLSQPFMFITRDTVTMEKELARWDPEKRQAAIDEQMNSIQATFDRLQRKGYLVKIHSMFHYNATDLPLLTPLTSVIGFAGPIDTARAHQIINVYTQAFFDKHLKGQDGHLLDGSPANYPEVEFAVHKPQE